MAKKADLQAAQAAYDEATRRMRSAEQSGNYSRAIACAIDAWEYLEGMMQYERRFEEAEFKSLPCIDLVLRLAPPLLEAKALDQLGHLLQTRKSIDRHASDDLAVRLEEARACLNQAHKLWDFIERNPGARQNQLQQWLGGDQSEWRRLVERWDAMNLIERAPTGGIYHLRIATDLDAVARGMCEFCGMVETDCKRALLSERQCRGCARSGVLVLLASEEPETVKE